MAGGRAVGGGPGDMVCGWWIMTDTLEEVRKLVDKEEQIRTSIIAYMHNVGQQLENKSDDDTDIIAEALGRFIAAYDDN